MAILPFVANHIEAKVEVSQRAAEGRLLWSVDDTLVLHLQHRGNASMRTGYARLDRLGRSLGNPMHLAHTFKARGVGFASPTEQIDTRSTTGQLVFHIFGALAEFECNLIRERTLAGLKASRARGSNDGRRAVRRCPFYALSKCLHLTRPPRETQ
jgi:hypothetical protein